MAIEIHPYTLVLVLTAVASTTVAVRAWQYRPAAGATPLAVLMVGVTEWLVFHALEVEATVTWRKLLWADLQWVGALVIPVAWLAFALAFTGRDDERTERLLGVLLLEPLLGLALLVTNPSHTLLWGEPQVRAVTVFGSDPILVATASPHVGAFAHAGFSYLLLFVGTVLLVQLLLQTRSLYQLQGFLVLFGVVLPWVANVLALLSVTLLDLTPLAFTGTGVALTVGLYRFRLLDLVPVAHDRVVANLDDGVLVFDGSSRIVDVNDAVCALFDRGEHDLIGHRVDDVFAEYDQVLTRHDDTDERTDEVSFEVDGDQRYFVRRLSPLTGRRDQVVGTIAVLHDITRQKQRERELERANGELARTNDRLDEFASVVSHDLRNPLNVARGRLDLARETHEAVHFEAIEESHERMERIVGDLLTLAREGASAESFETVPLAVVANDAWAVVDTGESVLDVVPIGTVTVDRQRVQQLFENLFRNAIEHNDDRVTIRVGPVSSRPVSDGNGTGVPLDDGNEAAPPSGFYVEDDGTGIPDAERESVFESGYSPGGGTGLGLAIVQKVAADHDWTVTVTDERRAGSDLERGGSAGRGARFEFEFE
ncbi:histidine kinase N-terminal 7TM domain-containing protein [Haloarchaeobius sp. DT45]|uniref:histidine kinase N-terminal 7TM domain-containing protein n=1 Tax=Haloarchaeobius sp. DT45 TaxID=3446116 RepID=UPI003F6D1D4D